MDNNGNRDRRLEELKNPAVISQRKFQIIYDELANGRRIAERDASLNQDLREDVSDTTVHGNATSPREEHDHTSGTLDLSPSDSENDRGAEVSDTSSSKIAEHAPGHIDQEESALFSEKRQKEKEEEQTHLNKTLMPFLKHFEEMRWMLFKCLIVLVCTTAIGLSFTESLYDLITFPIKELHKAGTVEIFYERPIGAFIVKLKMGFLSGLIVGLPLLLFFIWQFIRPGLRSNEQRSVKWALFFGFISFIVGACFGYMFLPFGLPVLVSFGDPDIRQLWYMGEYIGFCMTIIISFGLVFEMPILAGLLARLNLVTAKFLRAKRPFAVVIIFVLAAVLTPPDIFSQFALGIPMMLLYEVGILIAVWQEKKAV